MECNNKYCYFNAFEQCCHESEKAFEQATPNQLDCPSSLRADFQTQLLTLADECAELLYFRNMNELIQIKKFIESQRS
jgi:hypothetical protein